MIVGESKRLPVRTRAGSESIEWLSAELAQLRKAGRRIVTISGCFDLIHPGHTAALKEARSLGDVLIVLLNSDSSVQKLTGFGWPIVEEEGRTATLLDL